MAEEATDGTGNRRDFLRRSALGVFALGGVGLTSLALRRSDPPLPRKSIEQAKEMSLDDAIVEAADDIKQLIATTANGDLLSLQSILFEVTPGMRGQPSHCSYKLDNGEQKPLEGIARLLDVCLREERKHLSENEYWPIRDGVHVDYQDVGTKLQARCKEIKAGLPEMELQLFLGEWLDNATKASLKMSEIRTQEVTQKANHDFLKCMDDLNAGRCEVSDGERYFSQRVTVYTFDTKEKPPGVEYQRPKATLEIPLPDEETLRAYIASKKPHANVAEAFLKRHEELAKPELHIVEVMPIKRPWPLNPVNITFDTEVNNAKLYQNRVGEKTGRALE